ncbi:hypothetical protein RB195_012809 [Necator americanus]|uniref:Uncharacterized protein n=1 Tax=Necator americanus TaxID=51031 RepID=A0ABR1DVG6_NECAM
MHPHVHFNSKSFEVYERVTGLYSDLRKLSDESKGLKAGLRFRGGGFDPPTDRADTQRIMFSRTTGHRKTIHEEILDLVSISNDGYLNTTHFELYNFTSGWTSKVLSGREPEDQATSAKYINELNNISLVQVVILLQFTTALSLVIFSVVGVSVNQPIGFLLLLALLQFLIAIPGFAYHFSGRKAHFLAYLIFEVITLASELIWFVYSIATSTSTFITALILIVLIFVQTIAILSATLFKNVIVNLENLQLKTRKKHDEKDDSIEESRKSRSLSPSASKPVSSARDETTSGSTRRKMTSREMEQGIDKSTRRTQPRKKHSVNEESLRKFKEGRRKMKELAEKLKEKKSRKQEIKSGNENSEKQGVGTGSSGVQSTDVSSNVSRSTESVNGKANDVKFVSPLGTARDPSDL